MIDYRDQPQAIRSLVRAHGVHRDLYLSESLFRLEQAQLFANTWNFVGHASQIPTAGDFITLELAGRPLLMIRHGDGSIKVLMNRCAHKGMMLSSERSGNAGRAITCPYHGWAFRSDGSLLGVPLRESYEGTGLHQSEAGMGLASVRNVAIHRGFVFARLGESGVAFRDYFGDGMLAVLDNVADRSPEGELEVAGEPLRNIIRCNWKMYLENVNDNPHTPTTHQSSALTAKSVWNAMPAGGPKPMGMEQLLPFGEGYDLMIAIAGRYFPNGHNISGTRESLHTGYAAVPGYEEALIEAHGEARARAVLGFVPQNTVFYPGIALKSSPQTMRVLRPLAVDRTLVETWAFRARGAPALLLERTQTYNRLVFSPTSIVAHDDVHIFETMQRGLQATGNEWVSLHRGFRAEELQAGEMDVDGASEALVRNQHRAWSRYMTLDMPEDKPKVVGEAGAARQ